MCRRFSVNFYICFGYYLVNYIIFFIVVLDMYCLYNIYVKIEKYCIY